MLIKNLCLKNFRSHADFYAEFSPKLNILVGPNAAGKTNVAEAVYFCAVPTSVRTEQDGDLVRFGAAQAEIKATVESLGGTSDIHIVIPKKGRKKIFINECAVERAGELLGIMNAVFFSPEEIDIVSASPVSRRRFMDIAISQNDKAYFYALSRYNKILSQRNNYLKSGADTDEVLETLPVWDAQLAKEAAEIFVKRKAFIAQIQQIAPDIHARLTHGAESFHVKLASTLSGSRQEAEEKFLKSLNEGVMKDLRFGATQKGIHRDELELTANEIDMRSFGSCGQQRTAAITLKLAELAVIKEQTGETPVLILDDVLSELDNKREKLLLAEIADTQTILTTTKLRHGQNAQTAKIFKIK